jgi:hypothetical protein
MTEEEAVPWHTELAEAVASARKVFNEETTDLSAHTNYFNALCIPLGIVLGKQNDPAYYVRVRFDWEEHSYGRVIRPIRGNSDPSRQRTLTNNLGPRQPVTDPR